MGHHYINRSRLGRTSIYQFTPHENEELTAADRYLKKTSNVH